jgi:holo-[acyl-carrier protein] synthase
MMNTNNLLPIKGLGNDIMEIERIRKSFDLHGYRFITRLFSVQEQDYCLKYKDPIPHFAARFSAKESIVKALGTGFGKHASWLDIEILNDPLGKPIVVFSDHINETLNNPIVLITISHCQLYVSTVAVWVNTGSGHRKLE